jgi:hypothetical protein
MADEVGITTYFASVCTNLNLSLTVLQFRLGVKLGPTSREEHRLTAREKMPRGISGPMRGEATLHNEAVCTSHHMFVNTIHEGDETLIYFGRKI